MLLSTCFLIFILWFCCVTVLKDKKIKSSTKQIRKSIKESQTNVKELGNTLQNPFKKTDQNKNDIYVRDDSEYLIFKNLPNKKSKVENASKNEPAPFPALPTTTTNNLFTSSKKKIKQKDRKQ